MVAVIAERLEPHATPRHGVEDLLEEAFVAEPVTELATVVPFPKAPASARIAFVGADDPRAAPRREAALRCWLIDDEESARGYALDVSKEGARLCGVGSRYQEGQRLICKLVLDDKEPPLVMRCKVVRVCEGDVGVRFLELGFDEWYRLGRFVAGGAPVRPRPVLMPPA